MVVPVDDLQENSEVSTIGGFNGKWILTFSLGRIGKGVARSFGSCEMKFDGPKDC